MTCDRQMADVATVDPGTFAKKRRRVNIRVECMKGRDMIPQIWRCELP